MTFVDSAENYGAGQSEMLISRAVVGWRNEIFIATKVSPENFKKADLIRAADASLARLVIRDLLLIVTVSTYEFLQPR